MESTTVLKEFQEEISEMDRDDIRLKTIREWENIEKEKILVSETIPNRAWKKC